MSQRWSSRRECPGGGPSRRGGYRSRAPLAGALLFLAAFPLACGLFRTRQPEDPGGSNTGVKWLNPTAPDSVLRNIQVTFNAKSVNNYDRSLTDEAVPPHKFGFEPDPADVALTGEEFFANWDKAREVNTFSNIFQQSPGNVSFTWTPSGDPLSVPDQPNDRFYEDLAYRMVWTRTGADTTFSGKCDLYMRETSGLWAVYRWVDKQDGSANATLGLLRWKGKVVY